jgi:hypothetical protein
MMIAAEFVGVLFVVLLVVTVHRLVVLQSDVKRFAATLKSMSR